MMTATPVSATYAKELAVCLQGGQFSIPFASTSSKLLMTISASIGKTPSKTSPTGAHFATSSSVLRKLCPLEPSICLGLLTTSDFQARSASFPYLQRRTEMKMVLVIPFGFWPLLSLGGVCLGNSKKPSMQHVRDYFPNELITKLIIAAQPTDSPPKSTSERGRRGSWRVPTAVSSLAVMGRAGARSWRVPRPGHGTLQANDRDGMEGPGVISFDNLWD